MDFISFFLHHGFLQSPFCPSFPCYHAVENYFYFPSVDFLRLDMIFLVFEFLLSTIPVSLTNHILASNNSNGLTLDDHFALSAPFFSQSTFPIRLVILRTIAYYSRHLLTLFCR